MIEIPTTIVLGAGASIEFGFPSGPDLVQLLAVADYHGNLNGPCAQLVSLGYEEAEVKRFATALRLSGTQSVDAFLEHRPDLVEIGKAAIAAALIPHEHQFTLFNPPRGRPSLYDALWSVLRAPPDDFPMNKVKIVTFNYDRSLEEYLCTAIANSFVLSSADAASTVSQISINHVHGTLGNHPAFDPTKSRPYHIEMSNGEVTLAAKSIRIIHEQHGNTRGFTKAREALQQAERVYFLGLGYDRTNLSRLGVKLIPPTVEINGTAFGLAHPDRARVQDSFGRTLILGERHQDARTFIAEVAPLR